MMDLREDQIPTPTGSGPSMNLSELKEKAIPELNGIARELAGERWDGVAQTFFLT